MEKKERIAEVATFIKESVEWLIKEDCGCRTHKLDDRLAICVGWSAGYGDEHRDDVIQSEEDPDYAINVGIKVYTSDDLETDYDFINYPYDEDSEAIDTDISIRPDEDYEKTAEWLLDQYDNTLSKMFFDEDGRIILKTIPFSSGKEMLDAIQAGADLYSPTEELYVFLYNGSGSICVYQGIDLEEAEELEWEARENEEYWGAFLGSQGSGIYDDPSYEYFSPDKMSNLDWCEANYDKFWIRTSDVLKISEEKP